MFAPNRVEPVQAIGLAINRGSNETTSLAIRCPSIADADAARSAGLQVWRVGEG